MAIRKLLHVLLGLGLFLSVSLSVASVAYIVQTVHELQGQLASVNALTGREVPLASEVFDRDGVKIGEFAGQERYYVALKALPRVVVEAFLSAEDKDFYHHIGVSPTAIARAAWADLRGHRIRQGASTITQQLARMRFLGRERTFARKVKEILLALAIERKLTKDQILELYLNEVYLGNHSYGIEAAARNYFRKSARDLTVGEAALLAGLPQSPSRYAPNRHPARASRRQAIVLRRMEANGYLAKGRAKILAKQVVRVAEKPESFSDQAPYFVAEVQRELTRKFEYERLPQNGLKIYTTLDAGLQRATAAQLASALVEARGRVASADHGRKLHIEGAVFSVDPATGAVRAMQGGASFAVSQFNRSEQAKRRMGGLFLPLCVSLALDHGYTLASHIGDDPLAGHASSATLSLYDAVLDGRLLEASPLYTALGHGSFLALASKLGLDLSRDDGAIALGYGEVTPAQAAMAYVPFANGGRALQSYLIDRVVDATGRVIYQAQRDQAKTGLAVYRPQVAYVMNQLLADIIRFGHADKARGVSRLAGGVSAATDDLHNAWFVGVLPKLVTSVWIGAETGIVHLGASEAEAEDLAETAWASIMRAAPRRFRRGAPVQPPPGISFARSPAGARLQARSLPFIAGTEPGAAARAF